MNNGCEIAIERTGWGLCHYVLISLCGLCSLAEAGATLITIIVAPLIACDLHFTQNEAMILNATSSFGMALGAFFFGTLSDINGRKGSIPATMVIIFCAGMILCFSHTRFMINLSIFLLGLGSAGNNTVVRVYLIECLPIKKRGFSLVILDLLWVIGYLSALGVSWSLVPSIVRMLGKQFRPSSWRVLAGIGIGPSLIMACAVSLLPASPRYLIYHRRLERVHSVLQEIYAINTSKHVDTYRQSDLEDCIRTDEEENIHVRGCMKSIRQYFARMWKKLEKIHRAPFKRKTFAGLFACLLHFPGFIWLALWTTTIFNEMGKTNGDGIQTENSTCFIDAENMALGFLRNCHEIENSRFGFLLLMSMSYILGEVMLATGIDIIRRRTFLVLSGIVGGSASLGFILTIDHVARIVFSTLILIAYAISFTATNVMLLENYPTGLRGTVAGFTQVLPHLAAFFAKLFLSVSCFHSILAVSGILIGGVIIALPLSDLTGAPMQE